MSRVADGPHVARWLSSRDTGMSSTAILCHMVGGYCDGSYPRDPSDLGRCLRMLELFPKWKPRVKEMARYGGPWIGLAAHWDEIAASMVEEVGIDWSKGRSAPKTRALMDQFHDEGLRLDPKIEVIGERAGQIVAWKSGGHMTHGP